MILDRRTFLRRGMAGFGSIMLMPSCVTQGSPYRFFTQEEASCVIALCEQIIPADEHGGGATEAGVIRYIDRQLVAVFDYDQLLYQDGISAIQVSSMARFGRRFQELDDQSQLEFLHLLEEGALPEAHWGGVDQKRFFARLIDHTMQGFYGPPRHGGNRNYMSYRMMGLDFPLVVGRNHYHNLTEPS